MQPGVMGALLGLVLGELVDDGFFVGDAVNEGLFVGLDDGEALGSPHKSITFSITIFPHV
jgi:hypothetical protein